MGDFFYQKNMNELILNMLQGMAAFIATNLDDVVVLMVFFTQVNTTFRSWQVVVGQYLGFGVLLLLSLPGYFGGRLVEPQWIGLLGLVPLGIGIKLLFNKNEEEDDASVQTVANPRLQKILVFLPPQILQVAAVTVANGGDNIGIYVPLFASKNLMGLLEIIGTFLLMVAVWCWIAWRLVKQPSIGKLFSKYGDRFIPWVFIALGCYILYESGAVAYVIHRNTSLH
jgi:cadmium resistance transport/sequestration family protein